MQRAFIEEQAAQCGYCIAGMMMRAQALLRKNPSPTDADIRTAMEPNLCRCGTHMRIVRAVKRAAALMKTADAGTRGRAMP
jgi:nicotinate dehydrogenase subunit A